MWLKSIKLKNKKYCPSSFFFALLKGRQKEFPFPTWPPRRDARVCGRNIVLGGEVGRLGNWRLRSDVGLFS